METCTGGRFWTPSTALTDTDVWLRVLTRENRMLNSTSEDATQTFSKSALNLPTPHYKAALGQDFLGA